MDLEQIKTLTDLMVDNDLTEVMIRDGDQRIVLRRGSTASPVQVVTSSPPVSGPAPAPLPAAEAPGPAEAAAAEDVAVITSPMVGTYYSAADPDSAPFVNIGDTVNPESVVCIIEAMKVFNEIKAEAAGSIVSIEVQNGEAVEFGQVLFKLRAR